MKSLCDETTVGTSWRNSPKLLNFQPTFIFISFFCVELPMCSACYANWESKIQVLLVTDTWKDCKVLVQTVSCANRLHCRLKLISSVCERRASRHRQRLDIASLSMTIFLTRFLLQFLCLTRGNSTSRPASVLTDPELNDTVGRCLWIPSEVVINCVQTRQV